MALYKGTIPPQGARKLLDRAPSAYLAVMLHSSASRIKKKALVLNVPKPKRTRLTISPAKRGVVERAVEWTGMKHIPVQDRTRLVSDNGSSYLSHAFGDYLRMLEIRHIRCAPHHSQINGKIERFHETLKARLNLLVYTSPEQLRAAMAEFIEFYNHGRYHEGIGNVIPADVYYGRREHILRRRQEQKRKTLYERFQYNLGQNLNRAIGVTRPSGGMSVR